MAQLTIRTDDATVDSVRRAASAAGRSMNEHVVTILRAATDPSLAGDEAAELRARLARAGLLARTIPRSSPPPSAEAVAAAGRRAAQGRQLSDYVSEGRGDPVR